jgi:hypothetical protein
MRYVIVLALCAILSNNAVAQEVEDPNVWTEEFMQTLIEDGLEAAHEKIQASFIGKLRPYTIVGMREYMEKIENNTGKALGYEFVKKREYGESLISYGYYVKRETTPVIWKFVFYNPHSRNWILIGLIIQEDMQFLPLLD